MMVPLRNLLAALVFLPLLAQAADTYVLRNGDRVKGDLLRETENSYFVEVHLAPTIRDEREIAKKDVIRIIQPEAGLAEYEKMRDLIPAPDGLSVGDYKQRIGLLQEFVETYPSNSKIRRVMEIRDELRDEMRLVEEGARKIDGVLYPADELIENAYELDARIEARKIKDLVNERKHLLALRAYKEFQKDYSYTKVHMNLIPLIQKLIDAHTAQATEWRDTLEFRIEEREKGLESMTPAGRRTSERAIAGEKTDLLVRFRTETASQVGWVSIHPFSKESLDYTIQFAKAELKRIDNIISDDDYADGGQLFRELYKLGQQGADEKVMRDKIRLSQKLDIPKRYLDKISLDNGGS